MNPDTGHLLKMKIQKGEALPEGFDQLPKALQRAANMAMRGGTGVVDLRNKGPLQNWAKKKRKAKIAAASRRQNRAKK